MKQAVNLSLGCVQVHVVPEPAQHRTRHPGLRGVEFPWMDIHDRRPLLSVVEALNGPAGQGIRK